MAEGRRFELLADLSIPLRFGGSQPNAYGVEPAAAETCVYGDLVGDTRRGGSCNFERYSFIPHCSGTHTECVGHITHERISVRDCLKDVFIRALLVSVEPEEIGGDVIISADRLATAMSAARADRPAAALIVRTLPNDESKLSREYGGSDDAKKSVPPYFSREAMHSIVSRGVEHLLCDLPSIDRIYDEGRLSNHRIFWNVEEGSFETGRESRMNATITELIYVPNEIPDGEYLLNLQIAPFETDAAPSRPVLVREVI